MTRIAMLSILVLVHVGCGATLVTKRLPISMRDQITGLAVNHNEVHEVIAVFPKTEGAGKRPSETQLDVQRTQAGFASATEMYEINYCGALFMTRGLEVDLHPDSTIKRVKVISTSEVGAGLGELADAASKVAEAKKAGDEEPTDPVQSENDALSKEIKNLMLKANLEAIKRGDPLPYPGIG